jgi:RNA polymerase sigma-70 factor (ECF subfamily)
MSPTMTFAPTIPVPRAPMLRERNPLSEKDCPPTEPESNRDRRATLDEATLADLIHDYSAPLLGYVTKLTFHDRQLAEEIVQETFVRVWQRPNVLTSGHNSVGPWLFTVARNLVNDHRRLRAGKPMEVNVPELNRVPEERDVIEETLLAQDIQRAMEQLSPQHRAVLMQVYQHDLSFEDVARSLDIPIGTAKSRAHYALRSLRSVLQKLGIGS